MALTRSFTNYEEFTNGCERRLFYRKVRKVVEPASHYLAIGSFYHAVLAVHMDAHMIVVTSRQAIETLLGAEQAKPGWAQDASDAQLVDEAVSAVERVSKQLRPALRPTHVEAWSRDINPAAKYTAKLDLVSSRSPVVNEDGEVVGALDEPCVVDWKVNFGPRPKRSRESAANSAQLALYCLEAGVKRAFFVEIPRSPALPIAVLGAEYDDYTLARWRRHFDEQFAAMESRGAGEAAWKLASPSFPLCSPKWCPFWKVCPGGGQ